MNLENILIYIYIEREGGRERGGYRERQTGRQTDRQTDRTDRQRHMDLIYVHALSHRLFRASNIVHHTHTQTPPNNIIDELIRKRKYGNGYTFPSCIDNDMGKIVEIFALWRNDLSILHSRCMSAVDMVKRRQGISNQSNPQFTEII